MNHYSLTTPEGRDVRLGMQELWLGGELLPMGARLVARHVFESAEDVPLEVVYAFMLPRDAALRSFRIEGEGFSVKSEFQPVKKAEETYEQAMQEGKLACQTRNYRDGVTNLMVGNLQPGQRVTVHLEILAGVEARDLGFRFRFPFTLAPAYHSQARAIFNDKGEGEMELPTKSFGDVLLPPWRDDPSNLHRVGFDLKVGMPGGLASVESPSHALRFNPGDGKSCRVSLAPDRGVPNRDLVLEVKVKEPKPMLWVGPDETGKTSCAAWIPSVAFGEGTQQPSRIVFVLDRSGSMSGQPLELAKKGLLACLNRLSESDLFNLVAFDNVVSSFTPAMIPGGADELRMAENFLDGIQARGGTEIRAALEVAADTFGSEKGEIFLITDGQVYGTEDIIRRLSSLGQRVHTLGIGSASQDRFLSQVSRQTGGYSRFVGIEERIDEAALEIFAACRQPLATDLSVRVEGGVGSIEPAPPTRVATGMPLSLYGSADHFEALVCSVSQNGRPKEIRLDDPEVGDCPGETLRLLRGARLITDLESQLGESPRSAVTVREHQRLERKLETISGDYQLASKAMSLVAVVDAVQDQSGVLARTRVVPVGMPKNTSPRAYFGEHDLADRMIDRSVALLGSRESSERLVMRSIQGNLKRNEDSFEPATENECVDYFLDRTESLGDCECIVDAPSPPSQSTTKPGGPSLPVSFCDRDPVGWINQIRKSLFGKGNVSFGAEEERLVLEILAAMLYISVKVYPDRESILESKSMMGLPLRFLRDAPMIQGLPEHPAEMARKIMARPRSELLPGHRNFLLRCRDLQGSVGATTLGGYYQYYLQGSPAEV